LTPAARRTRYVAQLTRAKPQQLDQGRGRGERVGDRGGAAERYRGADLAADLGDHELTRGDVAAVALGQSPQRSPVGGAGTPDHDRLAHPSALRS
jgi:hypothetical protein